MLLWSITLRGTKKGFLAFQRKENTKDRLKPYFIAFRVIVIQEKVQFGSEKQVKKETATLSDQKEGKELQS